MAIAALKERIDETRKLVLLACTLKPDSEALEELSEMIQCLIRVLDGAAR